MRSGMPLLASEVSPMDMRSGGPLAARLAGVWRRVADFNQKYRAYSHLAEIPSDLVAQLDLEQRNNRARSPIHGMFISVKGNIPVANLPWTEGSAIFANRIAEEDAYIVRKLREHGGVILGATTLSELAM